MSTSPELWALSLSFITAEQTKKYFFKRLCHTPIRQTVHCKFKIQLLVKKCKKISCQYYKCNKIYPGNRIHFNPRANVYIAYLSKIAYTNIILLNSTL